MSLSGLSATQVAFMMIATMQAVAAAVWLVGAGQMPQARRAALHWAAYGAISAGTWLMLAARLQAPPLATVLAGVAGVIMLQRGVSLFLGRPPRHLLHLAALAMVVLGSVLGAEAAWRWLQAVLHYGALVLLYGALAVDFHRHARERLRMRWPLLLALPALLAAAGPLLRVSLALLQPDSVRAEMAADSAFNIATALFVVVVVVAMHATLMGLVLGRLVSQLRWRSRHDALTGLLNRRAMEELVARQLQHARRGSERFTLMMIDLDHFKSINDRHGHPVGDRALVHVAAVLRATLRDLDRVARFGGEEFLALLPGLAAAEALPVAERLRAALAARPLLRDGLPSIALSASIGLAEWRAPDEPLALLMVRADEALYRAKREGRDRVVVAAHAPPPATAVNPVA